jgi:hypothetical protein
LNTVFLSIGPLVISIEKLCLWNATVYIGPLDMLLPLNTSVQNKLPSFRDFLSLLSSQKQLHFALIGGVSSSFRTVYVKGRLHCVRLWRENADGSVFPSVIPQCTITIGMKTAGHCLMQERRRKSMMLLL